MNTLLKNKTTMSRPTTKCYQYVAENKKKYIKRTAKYAPQLLADGLTHGVVSDQGNLVHGMFDEPGSSVVDPFVNIESDKFDLMNMGLEPQAVDVPGPVETNE